MEDGGDPFLRFPLFTWGDDTLSASFWATGLLGTGLQRPSPPLLSWRPPLLSPVNLQFSCCASTGKPRHNCLHFDFQLLSHDIAIDEAPPPAAQKICVGSTAEVAAGIVAWRIQHAPGTSRICNLPRGADPPNPGMFLALPGLSSSSRNEVRQHNSANSLRSELSAGMSGPSKRCLRLI